MRSAVCPFCGYTKADAQFHMDHNLCKNHGNAPWEKTLTPKGGDYRPHYNKREADSYIEGIKANYERCLARESVWLEIIDDLMTSIASNNIRKLSQAYNRAAMKLSGKKELPQ